MDNIDQGEDAYKLYSSDVVRFFYQSFKYSQGSSALQKCLYQYAHKIGAFTEKISEDIPEDLLAKLSAPKYHELKDKGTREFEGEWRVMALTFAGVDSLTKEDLKPVEFDILVDMMIDRDKKFQDRPRKLKVNSKSPEPDSEEDPNASFIRRHVVLGESTHNPIFDRLFSDVKDNISKRPKSDPKLLELMTAWERKHPGFKFFPET